MRVVIADDEPLARERLRSLLVPLLDLLAQRLGDVHHAAAERAHKGPQLLERAVCRTTTYKQQ